MFVYNRFRAFIDSLIHRRKAGSILDALFQGLGLLTLIVILNLDLQLEKHAHQFLAIFSYVVVQWIFSSIPLYVSGMVGVLMTVLFGIVDFETAFSSFASPIIFLFMGGFLLARALEKLGLDKKLALIILSSRFAHGDFKRSYFVILVVTLVFSMWVSNTATMAMMLPIVIGLMKNFDGINEKTRCRALLGTAYAATVGGVATPIGSPPNVIAVGMLEKLTGVELHFFDWMKWGLPLGLVFLILIFFYSMRRVSRSIHIKEFDFIGVEKRYSEGWGTYEWRLLLIFLLTVSGWFLPSVLGFWLPDSEISLFVKQKFTPAVVALIGGLLLFSVPFYSKKKILEKDDIKSIDWGSLLLFASGISLGSILFDTGLAGIASDQIFTTFSFLDFKTILLLIIGLTIVATELTSNTAAANILLPILIAASVKANFSPVLTSFVVAMACNFAFMLPVATPPNAIVYGSGEVEIRSMVKEGFVLNIFGFIALCFFVILLSE